MNEFEAKQSRIYRLLTERGLDALLLRRASSFAWATCGAAAYVNTATTEGEAALLITPRGRYVLTNNIEAPRLDNEEQLGRDGWEFRVGPWYTANEGLAELTRGLRVGADVHWPDTTDLTFELARLRA